LPWLKPVIPATQEVEIERIMVWCQSRQKVSKTPLSTNKYGMVVHACNPSFLGGIGRRPALASWHRKEVWSEASSRQKCGTLSEKLLKTK
jgi:hypothetical protein